MEKQNEMAVCVKGMIIHNGKMLIIKRSDDSHFAGGTWECVGGKLEFEEDIEDALKREFKEEVGLDITVERLLYATTFMTDSTRQVVLLKYLCHTFYHQIVLSDEHSEYRWAGREELQKLLPQNILNDFKRNHIFSLQELQG